MRRFKKILLVLDPKSKEKSVLIRAVQLSQVNKAELKVVSIIEGPPPKIEFATPSELEQLIAEKNRLIEKVNIERKKDIKKLIYPFVSDGIKIHSEILNGKPFIEIIKQVLLFDFDLIIKNAEGKMGFMSSIFGSEDIHLMRKCPCPVWLIKPNQTKRFKRILAAVDINPFLVNNQQDELNKKIIELSISLAKKDNSELHILHVWSYLNESIFKENLNEESQSKHESLAKWEMEKRKEELEKLLSQYSLEGIKFNLHMLKGDPKKQIPKFSENFKVELLIMGTLGRTGVPGLFIGNTAETVLNNVKCSLLTLKPNGFISPVSL